MRIYLIVSENPVKLVKLIGSVNIRIRHWREPVGTRVGLPLVGNEVGDVRACVDELALYMWDGKEWHRITNRLFVDLEDTPDTYEGQSGKFIRVKETEDGLEFVEAYTKEEIDAMELIKHYILEKDLNANGYAIFNGLLRDFKLGSNLNAQGYLIKNLGTPVDPGDAVNLQYLKNNYYSKTESDARYSRKVFAIVPDEFDNINDAIDFLVNEYQGGTVLVKGGVDYTIDEPIVLKCGVWIKGLYNRNVPNGKPRIIANCSPAVKYDVYTVDTTKHYGSFDAGIEFITFDGQNTQSEGIQLYGHIYLKDVDFENFTTYPIHVISGYHEVRQIYVKNGNFGIYVEGGQIYCFFGMLVYNRVGIKTLTEGNVFVDTGVYRTQEDAVQLGGKFNVLERLFVYYPSLAGGYMGIRIQGTQNKIYSCWIYDPASPPNTEYSIYEDTDADENEIIGNWCKGYRTDAIYIQGANTLSALNKAL